MSKHIKYPFNKEDIRKLPLTAEMIKGKTPRESGRGYKEDFRKPLLSAEMTKGKTPLESGRGYKEDLWPNSFKRGIKYPYKR